MARLEDYHVAPWVVDFFNRLLAVRNFRTTSRQSCRTYLPGGGFWERIDDSDNYRCGMALIAREDSPMMATGRCCNGDIGNARASHAADPLHCGISSPSMSGSGHQRSGSSGHTTMHVRFAPKATILSSSCDRSQSANRALTRRSKKAPLFDHLVGELLKMHRHDNVRMKISL